MGEYKLQAVARDAKPTDGKIYVPAEVYGPGVDNQHVLLESVSFEKLLASAGKSSLVDLQINAAEPLKVIIKEVQRNPLKGNVIHVDLHQVKMDQKISAQVEIKPTGKSPAVSNLGGTLLHNLTKLNIECLPGDLISEIDVDLSQLTELGQVVRVEDLHLSDQIIVKNDPRTVVLGVSSPRKGKGEAGSTEAAADTASEGEVAPADGEAAPAE